LGLAIDDWDWRLAIGDWRLAIGDWRLAIASQSIGNAIAQSGMQSTISNAIDNQQRNRQSATQSTIGNPIDNRQPNRQSTINNQSTVGNPNPQSQSAFPNRNHQSGNP
jgi:hypothetical protein